VTGVLSSADHRFLRVVRGSLAQIVTASNSVIFDSHIAAYAIGMEKWPDILIRSFESQVPIEFSIVRITRVPYLGIPHLETGFHISSK
jgi:hypothetical protein